MADNAPTVRVDNAAMKDLERYCTEQILYYMADWIDALNKTGGTYPQIILPHNEAALKLRSMQGGG